MSWWQRAGRTIAGWFTNPPATPMLTAADGRAYHWGRFPLTLYVDGSAEEWVPELAQAVDDLEHAAGRKLFNRPPLNPLPEVRRLFDLDPRWFKWPTDSVLVTVEPAMRPEHPGSTFHEFDPKTGRVNAARVTLAPMAAVEGRWALHALHEMGHVVGLAHSPDTLSVMHRYVSASNQRLTPADVRALRSLR